MNQKTEHTPLPCDIVRDLLPLYHDGVVSETTGRAVADHLEGCPPCRQEYDDLCATLPQAGQEGQEETSTQRKFSAMMRKFKRERDMSTVAKTLAACALLVFLVITQIPFMYAPEEIHVGKVLRFEDEGESKFFILYSAPDSTTGDSWTIGTSDTLDISCQKDIFARESEDRRVEFLHVADGVNAEGTPYTTVTINGEVVWTEEEDGDAPVPDYVYACADFYENPSRYTNLLDDWEEGSVGVIYANGHRMLWDLDGTLLADDYPDQNGVYPPVSS